MYCDNCKWFKIIYKSDKSSQLNIIRCEYLKITDKEQDTLLWDSCKECEVKDY